MDIKKYLPELHTRQGMQELLEKACREAANKAVAEVDKEYRSLINQMQEDIDALSLQKGLPNRDEDPFYKSLYASFWGKGKEELQEQELSETVKFGRATGYITAYNVPMEREQSDEMRFYAQTIAYTRALEDPIVGAIPDAYQRFGIGRGVKFRCDHPKIQAGLDKFWRDNNMEIYLKNMAWLLAVESEFFPLYFLFPKTGEVKIREIQPAEIVEIETAPEDKSLILSYKREFVKDASYQGGSSQIAYYADINYYIQRSREGGVKSQHESDKEWKGDSCLVQFVKLMKNREVRSRVLLERVLKWTEFFKNWLIDRAIINHEKGRVVWILEINSRKEENWTRYKPAPAGGTVKISTPNRKWIPTNATINADDVKEDGLFLLYQIAAGVSLPIHVLTQRANEANYASLNKSENPMVMTILDFQDLIADGFLRPMFKVVIRNMQGINKTIRLRKYVKEYLRDIFREQYSRYKKQEISEEEMFRTIQSLTNYMLEDFVKSDIYKGVAMASEKIMTEGFDLLESMTKESYNIYESQAKISEDIIKKAFDLFENGFQLEIPAEDIPIDIIFPDLITEDPVDTARILQIYKKIGIASDETLMAKAGLDPTQEKYLLKKQQLENPKKGESDATDDDSKGNPADGEPSRAKRNQRYK